MPRLPVLDASDNVRQAHLPDHLDPAAMAQTSTSDRARANHSGRTPVTGSVPASVMFVRKDPATGFWPASWTAAGAPVYTGGSASAGVRPTSLADVMVIWKGADPSPAIVASGTGGMLDGIDVRFVVA